LGWFYNFHVFMSMFSIFNKGENLLKTMCYIISENTYIIHILFDAQHPFNFTVRSLKTWFYCTLDNIEGEIIR
jgi:hypothetical protein